MIIKRFLDIVFHQTIIFSSLTNTLPFSFLIHYTRHRYLLIYFLQVNLYDHFITYTGMSASKWIDNSISMPTKTMRNEHLNTGINKIWVIGKHGYHITIAIYGHYWTCEVMICKIIGLKVHLLPMHERCAFNHNDVVIGTSEVRNMK